MINLTHKADLFDKTSLIRHLNPPSPLIDQANTTFSSNNSTSHSANDTITRCPSIGETASFAIHSKNNLNLLYAYYNRDHFGYFFCINSKLKKATETLNFIPKEKCASFVSYYIRRAEAMPVCIALEEEPEHTEMRCYNDYEERRQQLNHRRDEKMMMMSSIEPVSLPCNANLGKREVRSSIRRTDWKCSKCYNINYSFRAVCNCCSISREASNQLLLQQQMQFSAYCAQAFLFMSCYQSAL